jgi:hypothetical protein
MRGDPYPDSPLDPSAPLPVAQDVVVVDDRGRIRLPAVLVSGVAWLAKASDSATALLVLDQPGQIVLVSWERFGEAFLARRSQLLADAEQGDRAAEGDLLLLADRYDPISIPKGHRFTLRPTWLLHLGLEEGARCRVYVERIFDRVAITSKAYRDQRLRIGSPTLLDLP